jgi:hypothetical protein
MPYLAQRESKNQNPNIVDPGSAWCSVDVEFISGFSIEQVVAAITKLPNPQIVIWYIGCNGLRQTSVQFYKNFLINPIIKNHQTATFWLVDLTAWSAFKNQNCSILKYNRCCDVITKFSNKQIKCIKSSEIFEKMQKLSVKNILDYFKKSLNRSFISQSSLKFSNNNIRTGEIFSENCPVISDWYNYDTSKTYSILQYFEGCLIVDEIVINQLIYNTDSIQIVFALPNDELKYYKDTENSFKKDIEYLLSNRVKKITENPIKVEIKFIDFKYGEQEHQRPYNAPGKAVNKNCLSYEAVVGNVNNDTVSQEEVFNYDAFER